MACSRWVLPRPIRESCRGCRPCRGCGRWRGGRRRNRCSRRAETLEIHPGVELALACGPCGGGDLRPFRGLVTPRGYGPGALSRSGLRAVEPFRAFGFSAGSCRQGDLSWKARRAWLDPAQVALVTWSVEGGGHPDHDLGVVGPGTHTSIPSNSCSLISSDLAHALPETS
jgi:hypothetical protein